MSLARRLRKFWNRYNTKKAMAEKLIATGQKFPWDPNDGAKFLRVLTGGEDLAGKVLLDFGCGIGRLLHPAISIEGAALVHGVDVAPKMLELGANYCGGLGVDPTAATWHLSNGEDCGDVPPGSVDVAYSALCFQHMPSRRVVAASMAAIGRALKPGGKAFLQFDKTGPQGKVHNIGFRGVRIPLRDFPGLASQAGLRLVTIRPWTKTWFVVELEKSSGGDSGA